MSSAIWGNINLHDNIKICFFVKMYLEILECKHDQMKPQVTYVNDPEILVKQKLNIWDATVFKSFNKI